MLVEPMLGVTLAPTTDMGVEKINVIPSVATVGVDCRVPPGHGRDLAERRVLEIWPPTRPPRTAIGLSGPSRWPATSRRSSRRSMDAIREWVGEHDPETTVVPTILTGFSDSRSFRAPFPASSPTASSRTAT